MKYKIIILAFCFGFICNFYSQINKDSLDNVWKNDALEDSIRIDALDNIFIYYTNTCPDSISNITDQVFLYYQNTNDKLIYATSLWYNVWRHINDSQLGKAYANLNLFSNLTQEIGYKKGIAWSLWAYGEITQGRTGEQDINSRVEYFNEALIKGKEINNHALIATIYSSLSFHHRVLGELERVNEFIDKSITQSEIAKQTISKVQSYDMYILNVNSIRTHGLRGSLMRESGNLTGAIIETEKSLEIAKKMKSIRWTALIYGGLGKMYWLNLNSHQLAQAYLDSAVTNFSMINDYSEGLTSAKLLVELYETKGDIKSAFEMHKTYSNWLDSSYAFKLNMNYDDLKYNYVQAEKKALDSLNNVKNKKIAQADLKTERAKIEHHKTQSYFLFSGLALAIIFGAFAYNRFKTSNKQKSIIESQKMKVDNALETLEEAHLEIKDSINYAERIQRSFLASKELLDENLQDYFVFFQPKDIVSGDFYWADKLSNGDFAIVNADSTGHGVPGAIMSILNISSIESAVKDKLTCPSDIFNESRKIIIERLKKDGSENGGKDGMDASLISFNESKSKMFYVAAQNPIWLIRGGELIEIKPEKMPVGKHDKDNTPFQGGEFDVQIGDQIYTLTDGFQDQFGGPKGKKFMVKKMREYILSISHLPMEEQNNLIEKVFSQWKGEIEQVDDVCIIGVKI